MQPSSRRKFISKSTKAGIATLIALPAIETLMQSFTTPGHAIPGNIFQTGFEQTPLSYNNNELEPNIDAMTMDIHYNKHAAAYCKNLKEAAVAEKVDMSRPVEDVLKQISKYSIKMRNNAGGHYNHELFWKLMTPKTNTLPSEKLSGEIIKQFGSMDEFKKQFSEAAKTRFGSGWAWLIVKEDHKLAVISTPNQDNTLMDISEVKGFPLIGLDVWEHAYYLKYHNLRADYITNFWKVLNWDYVSDRYHSI
jgi:Fe-Mn family superoxide dismutase